MSDTQSNNTIRHDWQLDEILALFDLSLNELIYQAQTIHRAHFNPNQVQLSSLLNIKTGRCSEDCSYCSQSARFDTHIDVEPLMPIDEIVTAAKTAKENGATRFCMGAAWRSPKDKDFAKIVDIVQSVKAIGIETCMTLGMLSDEQAQQLKQAGLDYYNHNVDTSEEYYSHIVTTHTYQDRLDTLEHIRDAGLKTCSGGIIGMGEKLEDRAAMLMTLANLPKHPDSVPINQLVPVAGTPLVDATKIDDFDMVRCIAVARILMPHSYVRLSAGRTDMDEALQALCFLAGANSIFYGDKLLTTANPTANRDKTLLARLGMEAV